MNYGNIKYCDIANGEGVRTSLFVSGCTHHCKGCFQPETWSFAYGQPYTKETEDQVVKSLEPDYIAGLTVLGGEPMEPENQHALLPLLKRVKHDLPKKNVWIYTGDMIEDLMHGARHAEDTDELLSYLDVLVDGPFVEDLKDISIRFAGSSNQRVIDVPKTLESGTVTLWRDNPIYATHDIDYEVPHE